MARTKLARRVNDAERETIVTASELGSGATIWFVRLLALTFYTVLRRRHTEPPLCVSAYSEVTCRVRQVRNRVVL